ncbi:MAG TPA: DUF3488 and transglutaminase-like domain-containing protein [Pseudomonadales bacterium]|nr:DUF3488 and transglutaminase-like domain-containing protein [Pseudomonadales bacterium]
MTAYSHNTSSMPDKQLSRVALLYLLAGFAGCVLLLSPYLPVWIPVIAGITSVWRLLIFSGRVSFPSWWQKFILVAACGPALFLQYGFTTSIEAFIALLLLGFALKLLEVCFKRDAVILLYLAFFVLMTFFIFQQSLWSSLLVFLHVIVLLAAIIAVYADDAWLSARFLQPLKKASAIFLWSLPVMLFMFMVMPRLQPLWIMPFHNEQARTGMSNTMSPGDISNLTNSADLVFRAHFDRDVPSRASLYWYGLILDHFDGVNWTASCQNCDNEWKHSSEVPDLRPPVVEGNGYQVMLEPQNGNWLYVLPQSQLHDSLVMRHVNDGIYRYVQTINERIAYDVTGIAEQWVVDLPEADRKRFLQLPGKGNERSRSLALEWRMQAGKDDDAVIRSALDFYHAQFTYTQQPPLLGKERQDDFLFNTRKGFCEYFSSSFVFLMRAAGIPARAVVGYMGGEVHPVEHYVTVRQYDAHAWAEVWLPGRGWVLVDPTAAVSPERIESGFEQTFADSPVLNRITSLQGYRHIKMLNYLRLQIEKSEYLWARWVLGYSGETQSSVLSSFGLLSPWRVITVVVSGVMGAFVLLLLFLFLRDRLFSREHPATRRYRLLAGQYARMGVVREVAESPLQFAGRVVERDLPGAARFMEVSRLYYQWSYLSEGNRVKNRTSLLHFMHASFWLYWTLLCRRCCGKYVFNDCESN